MSKPDLPVFDPRLMPFSPRGAQLRVGGPCRSGRLIVATTRGVPFLDTLKSRDPGEYFEIALFRGGRELVAQPVATPAAVVLNAPGAELRITFDSLDTLVLEGRGAEVRLLPCHAQCTEHRRGPHEVEMVDYRGHCVQSLRTAPGTRLEILHGTTVDGDTGPYKDIPRTLRLTARGPLRAALRLSSDGNSRLDAVPDFPRCVKSLTDQWRKWADRVPAHPPRYAHAAAMAWYNLWSAEVAPGGCFTHRAMLMSKNWMNQVWAWDYCFNALAVAEADPELALDQFRLFFTRQAASGQLPEPIQYYRVTFGYVKPPVQGWALLRLLPRLKPALRRRAAREFYEPLARWTRWWFEHRDTDGDGLCEYLHGNDSGWDNSTAFDQGYPTEGADLAAHLVLQQEALAMLARLLGREVEAARWERAARSGLRQMVAHHGRADGLVSPRSGSHQVAPTMSLINFIPLELGPRLPEALRHRMVQKLFGPAGWATPHGLASEAVTSAKYEPSGYWRGPVWAPSTYLIFCGLAEAGEHARAQQVAEAFCATCALDAIFWENYDAKTGRGLCCPAYTWTAAVFLLMAEWLAAHSR